MLGLSCSVPRKGVGGMIDWFGSLTVGQIDCGRQTHVHGGGFCRRCAEARVIKRLIYRGGE